MKRIVLVEDNEQIMQGNERMLKRRGYEVITALTLAEARSAIEAQIPDLFVLDIMLPDGSGLDFMAELRQHSQVPILLLTALGDTDHRVEGLRAGADDYLVKPFAFAELSARLDGIVKRNRSSGEREPTRLQSAGLELDLLAREARREGRRIELQPREFRLLEYLLRHAGQVVTRTMLLEAVWDYHFDPQTNVIDVHISRLRQKIDHGHAVPLLHTVRGAGYRLGN